MPDNAEKTLARQMEKAIAGDMGAAPLREAEYSPGFARAHEFAMKWEGGLSDVPEDRGGITKYGVSLNFLRLFARENKNFLLELGVDCPPNAECIRKLDREQATAIFRFEFWDRQRLDYRMHPAFAALQYDASVNCGPRNATLQAQRGVNIHGNCAWLLKEDGILGPKTRKALASYDYGLVNAILDARQRYYEAIVARDRSQKKFLNGWTNRVKDLRVFAKGLAGG